MKEINTKIGVFLTTYTQRELDKAVTEYDENKDIGGCALFMEDIRSFNPESPYYLSIKEAKELTGIEVKKNRKNPEDLYTNYNGSPLGLPVSGVQLLYKDPVDSLKSAFKKATPKFDFDKDFFHINIIK